MTRAKAKQQAKKPLTPIERLRRYNHLTAKLQTIEVALERSKALQESIIGVINDLQISIKSDDMTTITAHGIARTHLEHLLETHQARIVKEMERLAKGLD
ncbi:hypothetical protein V0288_04570 [Pannus brasiliensis CCIBt3594]|uniref:Uncharacterized protein n=1 Tax=Pannus brasiliensis CCIBt3594 TaxID=1427578 RepID=A0AAW9QH96_9CHRO